MNQTMDPNTEKVWKEKKSNLIRKVVAGAGGRGQGISGAKQNKSDTIW